ncbi:MAG: virulence RhuM family protein [Methanoregula sp.]|nr:virulence RhuM family protein [Methanoregula sp.]
MPEENLPEIYDADRAASEFLIYLTEIGESRVQVRLFQQSVWLTQKLIAVLFEKSVTTINEHIRNIYEEKELDPEATIRKFRIVQMEGSRRVERLVDFYNLDVILAVGYRVRSHRGTQFRQWATRHLSEYVTKGFVLDDERLKAGKGPGDDYFDELLSRIRDIRASERRFYQKITDIYTTIVTHAYRFPIASAGAMP